MSTIQQNRIIPRLDGITRDHRPTDEQVEAILHKRVAQALRTYNDNIAWVSEQLAEGNITREQLLKIVITVNTQQTHTSPIANAIDKLYGDPKWASLVEGSQIKLPTALVHAAAKLLTLNQISYQDFPPVCHTEMENSATACHMS